MLRILSTHSYAQKMLRVLGSSRVLTAGLNSEETVYVYTEKRKFIESTNLVVAGCHSHMLLSEHYT